MNHLAKSVSESSTSDSSSDDNDVGGVVVTLGSAFSIGGALHALVFDLDSGSSLLPLEPQTVEQNKSQQRS